MIEPEAHGDAVSATPRMLRQFAAAWLVVFTAIFALSAWGPGTPGPGGWTALAAGAVIGIPGLIRPAVIRPVWLASMALTHPIGQLVALVLLAVVYWAVLTPIALVLRLLGHDPLRLGRSADTTYWLEVRQALDVREYLRQYRRED